MARRGTFPAIACLAALALLVSCTEDATEADGATRSTDAAANTDGTSGPQREAEQDGVPILLSGQGNNLDAYSVRDGEVTTSRVITNVGDDPDGLDINAQLCVFERDGRRMLIAGEDTGQPDPPAGWGIFELTGDSVADLEATRVAKLTPTYQAGAADDPENYGCGVLPDGRILTTDVGEQVSGANGQLIIWFPPFEGFAEGDVDYCKLDVGLPTAQSILVTGPETFLVAASRGGIYEYGGPLPSDGTPAGGCDSTDSTGRGLATGVQKRTLVEPGANAMATPAGLAPAPDGGFYASSVFSGVINSYAADGTFRSQVLAPPEGEVIAETPYSTGTPLGLATDTDGNLYYADIGLVIDDSGVGPGDGTGSVRIVRFSDGTPAEPEIIADALAFPDGLGTFTPGTAYDRDAAG